MKETKKDFVRLLEKLVEPIDFSELERRGIVSKAGAWYRVHNWKALPEHASRKIRELAEDSKGIKVKFEKGVERTAAKLLRQLRSE